VIRIALAGKSGAGKTTLARQLSQICGVPVDSFAAPLKLMAAQLNVGGKGFEARRFYQHVGTATREALGDDVFVAALERRLAEAGGSVIIDDLRFPVELAWCLRNGFLLVYLEGSFVPLPADLDAHPSEQGICPQDCHLVLPAASSLSSRARLVLEALHHATPVIAQGENPEGWGVYAAS